MCLVERKTWTSRSNRVFLALRGCVTLGRLISLSEPLCPGLWGTTAMTVSGKAASSVGRTLGGSRLTSPWPLWRCRVRAESRSHPWWQGNSWIESVFPLPAGSRWPWGKELF